jgi:hypothetical protein
VLRAEEFDPLVEAGRRMAGATIEELGAYVRVSAGDCLRLEREATGLGDAVWFAAATGGIEGQITRFDDEVLEIAALQPN